MIAVQASYLDKAFDEEDQRQKEIQEKLELKKKLKLEQEEREEYDEEDDMDYENEDGDDDDEDDKKKKGKKEKSKGFCSCTTPECFVNMSAYLEEKCSTALFERAIIVLILLNTAFLASEVYEQPDWLTML